MTDQADDAFYDRADQHIHLSNDQLAGATRGKVSASMMYATARFNAWLSAKDCNTGADLASNRAELVAYFLDSYRTMLEENLDDYIRNFDVYMKTGLN